MSLSSSITATSNPSAPSSGNPNPEMLDRPSESDYLALERDLLDPNNAKVAATAVHEFLAALEKSIAPVAPKYYNSRQTLQAFLIQQQLVAGIPKNQIKPMPEFATKMNNEGVIKRVGLPAYLTITNQGTFVPDIPPAEFNGTLDPLPIKAGLPNPNWVNRSADNFRSQMKGNPTNPEDIVNITVPQLTQSMMDPNNASSKPAENDGAVWGYFSDAREQQMISQFFAEHFSTGSGILDPQSAMAVELADNGTDSDYNTDYWSDTNDE